MCPKVKVLGHFHLPVWFWYFFGDGGVLRHSVIVTCLVIRRGTPDQCCANA